MPESLPNLPAEFYESGYTVRENRMSCTIPPALLEEFRKKNGYSPWPHCCIVQFVSYGPDTQSVEDAVAENGIFCAYSAAEERATVLNLARAAKYGATRQLARETAWREMRIITRSRYCQHVDGAAVCEQFGGVLDDGDYVMPTRESAEAALAGMMLNDERKREFEALAGRLFEIANSVDDEEAIERILRARATDQGLAALRRIAMEKGILA